MRWNIPLPFHLEGSGFHESADQRVGFITGGGAFGLEKSGDEEWVFIEFESADRSTGAEGGKGQT